MVGDRLAVENRPELREELEFVAGLMRTPEVREGHHLVGDYRGVRFVRDAPRGRTAGK
jgi:hypothetical protein